MVRKKRGENLLSDGVSSHPKGAGQNYGDLQVEDQPNEGHSSLASYV